MRTISRFSSSVSWASRVAEALLLFGDLLLGLFNVTADLLNSCHVCKTPFHIVLSMNSYGPGPGPFSNWGGRCPPGRWPFGTGPGWWSRQVDDLLRPHAVGQKKQEDLPGWGRPASSMALLTGRPGPSPIPSGDTTLLYLGSARSPQQHLVAAVALAGVVADEFHHPLGQPPIPLGRGK